MAGRAKFAKLFKKETPLDDRELWREMRQAKYHGVKEIEEVQRGKKSIRLRVTLRRMWLKEKNINVSYIYEYKRKGPLSCYVD